MTLTFGGFKFALSFFFFSFLFFLFFPSFPQLSQAEAYIARGPNNHTYALLTHVTATKYLETSFFFFKSSEPWWWICPGGYALVDTQKFDNV